MFDFADQIQMESFLNINKMCFRSKQFQEALSEIESFFGVHGGEGKENTQKSSRC